MEGNVIVISLNETTKAAIQGGISEGYLLAFVSGLNQTGQTTGDLYQEILPTQPTAARYWDQRPRLQRPGMLDARHLKRARNNYHYRRVVTQLTKNKKQESAPSSVACWPTAPHTWLMARSPEQTGIGATTDVSFSSREHPTERSTREQWRT